MTISLAERQRRAALGFAALVALAFAGLVLYPLLAPLVLAALMMVLFLPVHRRIEARLGVETVASAVVSTLILVLLVAVPTGLVVLLLVVQARRVILELLGEEAARSNLVQLLDQYLDWGAGLLHTHLGGALEPAELKQRVLYGAGAALSDFLPTLVGYLGALLLGLVVLAVVLFFLLLRGRRLLSHLVELSPLPAASTHQILARLAATIRGVFAGAVATALVQGAVGALGYALAGFSNFLVWGALIVGAGLVPYVGTGLVWVPTALYLLLTGQLGTAAAILAVGVVVSTVDNLVRPLLIHRRAVIHPLLVFLSILGCARMTGPMGLVYGPLLAAALTEAVRLWEEEQQRRQAAG